MLIPNLIIARLWIFDRMNSSYTRAYMEQRWTFITDFLACTPVAVARVADKCIVANISLRNCGISPYRTRRIENSAVHSCLPSAYTLRCHTLYKQRSLDALTPILKPVCRFPSFSDLLLNLHFPVIYKWQTTLNYFDEIGIAKFLMGDEATLCGKVLRMSVIDM